MTEQVRRKLIEVALPLGAINRESAREKSIRHGHPSTLHLWWARRPPACDSPLANIRYQSSDGCPTRRSAAASSVFEVTNCAQLNVFRGKEHVEQADASAQPGMSIVPSSATGKPGANAASHR